MKQFLLNQTMDDADEGCLGGLVFHWYCIVNSRPKSHSDSQPANPSFLLFLTSCTPLSLSSFAYRSLPFPLCVSYREIIHEKEARATLAALSSTSFPLHLFANHLSRVRVCFNIYIYTFLAAYYAQITCHVFHIYLYTSPRFVLSLYFDV